MATCISCKGEYNEGNCSVQTDLDAFGVTLSEAKGLVLRTNEILRFAQNDRLSSYQRRTSRGMSQVRR